MYFLYFYIKGISIPPGFIKSSNTTNFKINDWLKLCVHSKKKKKLRITTHVLYLSKRPKGLLGLGLRDLKGSKLFVCGLKVNQNAFKHKYKTINKSQGTKAVHLTQQSYDQLGTAKLNETCPGPEGQ